MGFEVEKVHRGGRHCAKRRLPFECVAPSPERWCKTIEPFQPVCEQAVKQYGGVFVTGGLLHVPPHKPTEDRVGMDWSEGTSVTPLEIHPFPQPSLDTSSGTA